MCFKFPGEVQVVPSQLSGPLPSGYVGLILPRSSMGKKGIFVIPGVIDSDYTGVIFIQLWTNMPQTLPSNTSPAQLLHLPYFVPAGGRDRDRGDGGFGSTDPVVIALTTPITTQRPRQTVFFQGKPFEGIIDTGADVSVISAKDWPASWPTDPCPSVWGVGGRQGARQSTQFLSASLPNSTVTVQLRPFILDIHVNLWGRDLLSKWGATVTFDE